MNEALKRAEHAAVQPVQRQVSVSAFEEALVHGIRYFMAAERGALTRGIPTSWATLPLVNMLTASEEPPPVWPDPNGTVRVVALRPLHHSVAQAVKGDSALYEMLALIDALREGGAKERRFAEVELGPTDSVGTLPVPIPASGGPSYKEL